MITKILKLLNRRTLHKLITRHFINRTHKPTHTHKHERKSVGFGSGSADRTGWEKGKGSREEDANKEGKNKGERT